ncbi:MAG: 3-hydroxyacyl-ACP dehydratase FabZ [Pseudomonadota bacterium]
MTMQCPLHPEQIKTLVPHRPPFLLLDRIDTLEKGKGAIARKAISLSDPCFQGHFPDKAIFPGVLVIEALAQAAIVSVTAFVDEEILRAKPLVYITSIDKARFRKPILPGDLMILDVTIQQVRGRLYKFYGKALVEDRLCVEASFGAMMVDSPAQA